MADRHNTKGAPPTHVHIEKNKQPGWLKALAWIALIAGILALLLGLSHCNRNDTTEVRPAATPIADSGTVVGNTPNANSATALAGTSALSGYLAGTEAAPRRFEFEKLNFDTAKSEVRLADAAEVIQIATVLKQYGSAHIRIAGYADARGSSAANNSLGKARAEAVKAALVKQGVDADRIETVSGGEADPVDSNATASGQAQNRRTELVVTSR
ncbi:OmpA family protein [Sphingomonas sp. PsM26]|jgi:outer membrane protein OmpA-like peptidoglycan-associated protein|nr:OmpA family protein [Sphingomonas sp. PsM26]